MSATAQDNTAPFEFIVHVGDGKTGTSAIQRTLRDHAPELADAGIAYLGLMLERAPVRLHDWQAARRIEAFHSLGKERGARELADALRACIAPLRERGLRRVVVSNESLFGRSAATIATLEQLRGEGHAVRVVAYVRRHDAWARSAYAQWGLKHKTYDGPVRDFAQWSAAHRFALAPKVAPWHAAFGEAFQLRNFDAVGDVVSDFLALLDLDPARFGTVRRNESPSPEELALRTLFNHREEGRSPPVRFANLFDSANVDFRQPLGPWVKSLWPTPAQLQAIADAHVDDRARVDAILAENGQPPMETAPLPESELALDSDLLIGALFQLVSRQALRLEKLEARVASLSASAQVPAQASAQVPAQAAAAATDVPADPAVIAALAPALGYFGPLASDCLVVQVGGQVRGIRLALDEARPTFLNLRSLELLHEGKPVAVPPGSAATQSSVADNQPRNGPDSLLGATGIHSAAEHAPWWQVAFGAPVAIDALRVFNRGDGWSCRSRTLRIEVEDAEGRTRCVHDGRSPALLAKSMGHAWALAGMPDAFAWPATPEAARGLRDQLAARIAARLRDRRLGLKDIDWRALAPLLPVWGQDEPAADEWTLIAAFLLSQQQGRGGTSIKVFSLLLHSQARLERLQAELNALSASLGLGGFMLTRHGVKAQGMLRREPARFLDHLCAVVEVLRDLGREPVLAYGTLLGAVREGDFIAHDDDIDLLYRSRCRSRAEVEAELPALQEALRARGFKVVSLLPNSLNIHVIDSRNGAVMDVFPCWEEQGRLCLHMESMKIRGIDPAIVYPPGTLPLLGRTLPAPADPEAFLQERYGDGWRVSDQFFEWPWPLKQEKPQ